MAADGSGANLRGGRAGVRLGSCSGPTGEAGFMPQAESCECVPVTAEPGAARHAAVPPSIRNRTMLLSAFQMSVP